MKFTSTLAIILNAVTMVSAAPAADAGADLVPSETFTTTNTYTGELRSLVVSPLEKRAPAGCGGSKYVGASCTVGKCECRGDAGCYSCNGGAPKCQATYSNGQPYTCYQ